MIKRTERIAKETNKGVFVKRKTSINRKKRLDLFEKVYFSLKDTLIKLIVKNNISVNPFYIRIRTIFCG